MRKKFLSMVLVLIMVFSMLPISVQSGFSPVLIVGDTNVSRTYTDDLYDTTIHYWKMAESGDSTYTETGSEDDYLFSVKFSRAEELFTLTLNGVDVTSNSDIEGINGIFCNVSLDIVLTDGTDNSVSAAVDDAVFVWENISISGSGGLTVTESVYENAINSGLGNISIEGGSITVGGNRGISAESGSITISGGTVTAAGRESGIYADGGVSITASSYKYRTNTDVSVPETGYTAYPDTQFTNSSTYKYVEIIECFDVYAGGVKVSGIESGNISYWLNDSSNGAITGEGASAENYNVKYDEGSNTLTLNDADITGYHEISDGGENIRYGIYSSSELNLRLNGNTNNSVGISDEYIDYGVFAWDTLTVGGEGALALVGSNIALQTGICGVNGITIAGGEVTVSNVGYGITANNGSITVLGGVTEVSASVFGLLSNDMGTAISGGTTTAIGDSRAFYTLGSFSVNMPSYIHKTNTEPLAPATSYDFYPGTPFAAANIADYKYVTISSKCAITRPIPENGSFTVSVDGVTVTEAWPGDTVALAATPDSHYLFSSWYVYRTSDSAVTAEVNADSFIMPPYPVTVEASFTPETYTITYYQNDGSGSVYTTQTNVPYRNTLAAPAAPTRGGYTFNGWYKEAACVNLWNFASETVTDATSLYAKWTENSSDDDGGRSYTVPSRTITVSKTSSNLFSGSIGTITAEANMEKAFSNSVEVKVTDTNEDAASFGLGVGNEVYPFDISLYIRGTDTRTKPAAGYTVKISLPVPESLLDRKESLSVVHKSDGGAVTTLASKLEQRKGVWYIVFEATNFSPYALVLQSMETQDEKEGLPYYLWSDGSRIFIGFAAHGRYIAPDNVTVLLTQNGKSFKDVPGHWAADYIGFVAEREIFLGTDSNTFSPDTGMSRAMFAAVIGRLYEHSYGKIEPLSPHTFIDCDYDAYYGRYVDWAAENDIICGYGNESFGPDDQITREQMAAILYRFADFTGFLPDSMDTGMNYPDADRISGYAKNAALYCQTTGIIGGREGGMFAPQETASRAETSAIIRRFIEFILRDKGTGTLSLFQ